MAYETGKQFPPWFCGKRAPGKPESCWAGGNCMIPGWLGNGGKPDWNIGGPLEIFNKIQFKNEIYKRKYIKESEFYH